MQFIRCSNLDELSKNVALIFKETITNKPNAILGLATGSSPISTYKELIEMFNNNTISFKDVTTFNLDEYVGLSEKNKHHSYRYFMNDNLFGGIDIDLKNTFFPINWDENVDLSKIDYSNYDELIDKKGGMDLLILGLGNNGHIGFNEPGSKIDSKTKLTILANSTIEANARFFENKDEVPKYAISMGINTILKAKKIILIVVGESKKEALFQLKNSISFDEKWPCTALTQHDNVFVYYI